MKLIYWILGLTVALASYVVMVSPAYADGMTLTTPSGVTFTLRDSPCGDEIASLLKDEYRARFKGGTASYAGQTTELCWMGPDEDNDVILINAQGQGIALPMAGFMKTSAVRTPKASI